MISSIKKLGTVSIGLWFCASLGHMGEAQAWEPQCNSDNLVPEVIITEPAFGTTTDASEITIRGIVREECSLATVYYENEADASLTGGAKVDTNFEQVNPNWRFEIKGTELVTAEPGESQLNRIWVTAKDGAGNIGQEFVDITHELPAPPDPSEGLPSRRVKGKVTWFYSTDDDQIDRFSTNAVLELPLNFTMPCGVWDDPEARNRIQLIPHYIILTLFASDPDNPGERIQLWTTTVNSKNVGTCRDVKYRVTGPKPGLREIYMEARSDNSVSFYTFAESLQFLPSMARPRNTFPGFIRSIPEYFLQVVMDLSQDPDVNQVYTWDVLLGPQLSFEEFSTRTVVRFNR